MTHLMRSYLDFEKPVAELDAKIDELRALAASGSDIADEISRVEDKAGQALDELYAALTPWQKAQVARHPQRPHCVDYVSALITEFTPLAGDRKFGDGLFEIEITAHEMGHSHQILGRGVVSEATPAWGRNRTANCPRRLFKSNGSPVKRRHLG
jgi:acetyl-CoA carboxylase carboxyl transferase subunit alpha